jgi:hypothetical protein
MREANEEIVRRYLELEGYFVRSRVPYRHGRNQSDIDLCGLRSDGEAVAVEVKGWHGEAITPSYIKQWPDLFHFAERPEAQRVLSALFGSDNYRRVLVVGRLGSRDGGKVLDYARTLEVEILEFPTILRALISATSETKNAPSDAEHMIRLLRVYDLLPDLAQDH